MRVPYTWRNEHDPSSAALVALIFFLVQQSLVRLLVREFGIVPRRVGRLAFRNCKLFEDRLGVSLLRDRESATIEVSHYFHAQGERHLSHVGYLEKLLQRIFHHRHGVRGVAGQKMIVHVEGQVDLNSVVIVQVDTDFGQKRNEAGVHKGGIYVLNQLRGFLG